MVKLLDNIKKMVKNITNKGEVSIEKRIADMEENYLERLDNDFVNLYNNFFLRIDAKKWNEVLKQASSRLENQTISNQLIKFLMENYNLPNEVWNIFDKHFKWSDRYEELSEMFPENFIQFMLSNINYEYKLRYNFFKEEINGSYDDFISFYYKAYFALKRKEMYSTEKSIIEAKKIFSEHPDLIILEGKYYSELNNIEKALERLSYAVEIDSKNSDSYYNRAGVYLGIGRFEEAYKDYHTALTLGSENANIQYSLANCCLDMGKYEEAKDIYDELIKKYPEDEWIISNLNSVNNFLIDRLEGKIATGNYDYSDKITLARICFYFEDYSKCYELLRDIEKRIKPSSEIYLLMADSAKYLSKADSAVGYYDKVIALEPDNWETRYKKGVLLNDTDKYEEAIQCFNTLMKLKPDSKKAYVGKGIALSCLNDNFEALECFNKAVELDKNDWYSYYFRTKCLIKLNEYQHALECIEKAVELSEGNLRSYYMRGIVLSLKKDYESALGHFRWCHEYENSGENQDFYNQVLFNAAFTMFKSGEKKDAYDFFNKVIDDCESYIPAYGGKILIFVLEGNYDECFEICASALNIHDENCKPKILVKKFQEELHKYALKLDMEKAYKEISEAVDNLYHYAKRRG